MSITDEHQHDLPSDEADLTKLPIPQIVTEIWLRRRWLATLTGLCMVLSLGSTLLLPNEYTSSAQLMPQDQQTFANVSALNALSGGTGFSGGGGGLLTTRTPGQTSIGVMKSRTVQEDIITRFGLLGIYHRKLYSDARKELSARTAMEEDKNTGIVSIAVEDRDPHRAQAITAAYIEDLNRLLSAENASSAHLERVFLENELTSVKVGLDAISAKLSEFSSRNATLNPEGQGRALIDSEAKLQGDLITAQSELYGLKAQYSPDNVRVRSLQARVDELKSQLRAMSGSGEKDDGTNAKANESYPSMRQLPILGATYYDLSRQVTMQQEIYASLTKQYELAKVQEAKELPTVKILDKPELPIAKSSPHRLTIAIFVGLLSLSLSIIWIAARKFWELVDMSHPTKATVISTLRMIQSQRPIIKD